MATPSDPPSSKTGRHSDNDTGTEGTDKLDKSDEQPISVDPGTSNQKAKRFVRPLVFALVAVLVLLLGVAGVLFYRLDDLPYEEVLLLVVTCEALVLAAIAIGYFWSFLHLDLNKAGVQECRYCGQPGARYICGNCQLVQPHLSGRDALAGAIARYRWPLLAIIPFALTAGALAANRASEKDFAERSDKLATTRQALTHMAEFRAKLLSLELTCHRPSDCKDAIAEFNDAYIKYSWVATAVLPVLKEVCDKRKVPGRMCNLAEVSEDRANKRAKDSAPPHFGATLIDDLDRDFEVYINQLGAASQAGARWSESQKQRSEAAQRLFDNGRLTGCAVAAVMYYLVYFRKPNESPPFQDCDEQAWWDKGNPETKPKQAKLSWADWAAGPARKKRQEKGAKAASERPEAKEAEEEQAQHGAD